MINVALHGIAVADGKAKWSGAATVSVRAEGHSGYSIKGNDPVCASVSVLVQAVARSMAAEGIVLDVSGHDGLLGFSVDWDSMADGHKRFVIIAMNILMNGLLPIEKEYPAHLKVITVE